MQADGLPELLAEIEKCTPLPSLDLEEVTLLDRESVRFLIRCESKGVQLVNCPLYVREWIQGKGKGGQIKSDPEPVFVNAQALDFVFQCRPRNSQPSGSSIRTRNAAAGFRKRRFDELSFLVNQRRLQTDRRLCFRLQPRLLHRERVGVAEDHGSFDDILKLPDIARPVIALEKLRCPLFYPSNLLARLAA